jgi:hypothetical protein
LGKALGQHLLCVLLCRVGCLIAHSGAALAGFARDCQWAT